MHCICTAGASVRVHEHTLRGRGPKGVVAPGRSWPIFRQENYLSATRTTTTVHTALYAHFIKVTPHTAFLPGLKDLLGSAYKVEKTPRNRPALSAGYYVKVMRVEGILSLRPPSRLRYPKGLKQVDHIVTLGTAANRRPLQHLR